MPQRELMMSISTFANWLTNFRIATGRFGASWGVELPPCHRARAPSDSFAEWDSAAAACDAAPLRAQPRRHRLAGCGHSARGSTGVNYRYDVPIISKIDCCFSHAAVSALGKQGERLSDSGVRSQDLVGAAGESTCICVRLSGMNNRMKTHTC